jgi:membrane fusion protein (multidrug efflux system)
MPVELDVNNADAGLSSGMFPEVVWAVCQTGPFLFVPVSAVVRTTEATFVVRIRDGNTEWVNVQTGELDGKSIEAIGGLRDGDEIAAQGTDELRPGTHVAAKQIPAETQTRK